MARWWKELGVVALAGAVCGTVLPRVLLPPSAQARGIPAALRSARLSTSAAPSPGWTPDVHPVPARRPAPHDAPEPVAVVTPEAPTEAAPSVPSRATRERVGPTGLRGLRRGHGRWLVDLRGVESPRALLSGMSLSPPGEQPDATDGYRVTSTDRAGYARAAGIRPGDVLLSVNGHPLRNADDALDALILARRASRISLVFRRGASRYTVPVEIVGRPDGDPSPLR